MVRRFNPAPGWPRAPLGYLPPAGWEPDPSWPVAPQGWPVVVDETGRPVQQLDSSGRLVAATSSAADLHQPSAPRPAARSGGLRWLGWLRNGVLMVAGASVAVYVGLNVSRSAGFTTTTTKLTTNTAQPLPSVLATGSGAAADSTGSPSPSAGATNGTSGPGAKGLGGVTYSGSSGRVQRLTTPVTAAMLLIAEHPGAGFFVVQAVGVSPTGGRRIVDVAGGYKGTRLIELPSGVVLKTLNIISAEPWTLSLRPISAAPTFSRAVDGQGDAVLVYSGGRATLTMSHRGLTGLTVRVRGDHPVDLVTGHVGRTPVHAPIAAGPVLLVIRTDRAWSLSVA